VGAVLRFGVTWDYRCPFARNAHEHVVRGLRSGADWEVRFVPFSLGQVHVAEGDPDVWDDPGRDSGLLALQAGVVVRDRRPDRFPDVHLGLFAARHDHGRDLRDPEVVAATLDAHGVDAAAVLDEVADGAVLDTVRREHERAVADHGVWGVPTFLTGERAAFVRLMDRPVDDGTARRTVERVMDLLDGWPELNEFKHTSLDR
jgi:hypothetical protein